MKNIILGQKAKDKITGFKGILIGKITYLTGCDQYGIAPAVGTDGKVGDTAWFDEGRIVVIGKGITIGDVSGKKPGGPNRDTPR